MSKLPQFKETLKRLQAMQAYVGIAAEDSSRPAEEGGERGELNNAELLYIHTHGSVRMGIPARPVIEPAIQAEDNKANINLKLNEATTAALHGDLTGAREELEMAGIVASNASKMWFTDPRNGWPENSPRTIAEKGSDRPLIDKGIMRGAIKSFVKEG